MIRIYPLLEDFAFQRAAAIHVSRERMPLFLLGLGLPPYIEAPMPIEKRIASLQKSYPSHIYYTSTFMYESYNGKNIIFVAAPIQEMTPAKFVRHLAKTKRKIERADFALCNKC